jgi:SAM-dependent methyltransferase
MKSHISQVELQTKIHAKKINIETFFGSVIAPYLIRRFQKKIAFPLLDAGSGDGAFIRKMREKFPEAKESVFGIDLVSNPELNIIAGDLKNMPFEENQFKTIICSEVLEHLDDETLEKTLWQFKRIIDINGYIICTVPFDENIERSTFTCPHCEKSFHKFGHVRSWHSKDEIFRMFEYAGLSVEEVDILPLGAIAKLPLLRLVKFFINKLNNPPGLRKRAIIIAKK